MATCVVLQDFNQFSMINKIIINGVVSGSWIIG